MTIADALKEGCLRLQQSSPTPRLDAELLLAHALGATREYVLSHPQDVVNGSDAFFNLVQERARYVPIAYLTGTQEFYGREFAVTRDTLIPRPDTEALVNTALDYVREHNLKSVADIGTGTGNIGITIALELPGACVTLTDLSEKALDVARANAKRLGTKNIGFYAGDLLSALPEKHDLIVSNPPYLAESWERHPSIQHEPFNALFAENDGLELIEKLIRKSGATPVILEFDPRQEQALSTLAKNHSKNARIFADLSGKSRVAIIEPPAGPAEPVGSSPSTPPPPRSA